MILKFGMQHQRLNLYKVYIIDDPGLTLTAFMARSKWVAYVFEWGKHGPLVIPSSQQGKRQIYIY